MIYIVLISIIASYICNQRIYKICDELNQNKLNTIIIYVLNLSSMSLIYYKYGINAESIKYISLIPFIIVISIIDYHTTYIYDITVLSGIIIQGVVFLITIKYDTNTMSHIVALLIGFIVPYILATTTKSLGQGDIGVYCLCCFVLGHNYSMYLIALSFILACPYSVYILLYRSDKMRKIPFAPFISLATITIIITNYDILNLYFGIISK